MLWEYNFFFKPKGYLGNVGLSALGMTAVRTSSGGCQVEALAEPDTETMNLKIMTTKSRQILGFCAICTAVAFVSVSAEAQNAELDMELLRAAFEAADETGGYPGVAEAA